MRQRFPLGRSLAMTESGGLLLGACALAFYAVGQVWLVQLSSYRLSPLVSEREFRAYHAAWWRSISGRDPRTHGAADTMRRADAVASRPWRAGVGSLAGLRLAGGAPSRRAVDGAARDLPRQPRRGPLQADDHDALGEGRHCVRLCCPCFLDARAKRGRSGRLARRFRNANCMRRCNWASWFKGRCLQAIAVQLALGQTNEPTIDIAGDRFNL